MGNKKRISPGGKILFCFMFFFAAVCARKAERNDIKSSYTFIIYIGGKVYNW